MTVGLLAFGLRPSSEKRKQADRGSKPAIEELNSFDAMESRKISSTMP